MKLVKYQGKDALIVGWAPGPKGQPMAMLAAYGCPHPIAARLDDVTWTKLPHKLRRRLKHKPKKTVEFESFMDDKLNQVAQ